MKEKVSIAVILIAIVVILGFILINLNIITFFDGAMLILLSDNKLEITNNYEDEFINIQLAKTPDKYLVVLTLLDSNKTLFSGGERIRSYLSEEGKVTSEATQEYLKTKNIFVYSHSGLIRKPLMAYHFGDIGEVTEYETMELAREALNVPR